jgi:hypothetical protein
VTPDFDDQESLVFWARLFGCAFGGRNEDVTFYRKEGERAGGVFINTKGEYSDVFALLPLMLLLLCTS